MGVLEYSVRHMLGASYEGGGLHFLGNTLYVAVHGRILRIDLVHGNAVTLPYESTRTLHSLSISNTSLLAVNTYARAILLNTSGRLRESLQVPLWNITASSISPCGRLVAFSNAQTTLVWKVPADPVPGYTPFEQLQSFRYGAAGKACLAWTADSKHLAIGGRDGICRVVTLHQAGKKRKKILPVTLCGHREPLVVVRFCGQRGLVTISSDGALFCWRLRYNNTSADDDGNVSSDSEFVAANEEVEEADKSNSRDVGIDEDIALNEDDDNVDSEGEVSSAEEGGTQRLDGESTHLSLPLEACLCSRHFVKKSGAKRVRSGDVRGNLVVVGMSSGVFALHELPKEMGAEENQDFDDSLFALRDEYRHEADEDGEETETKKYKGVVKGNSKRKKAPLMPFTELGLIHTLRVSAGAITDLQFNDTAEWIALASSHSGQLVVWEWKSETHILKQQAHVLSASAVAFSSDGRAIATGSLDGRVKLWGVSSGFCAATFADHTAAISDVTFSGKDVVISSSLDGTVRAFDIRRYRNFRVLVGPPPRRQFGCVAVDEAGDLVAAGCTDTFEIIVWSLRTGKILEVLAGHKGPVSSIAFRPRRGTLASASWDRTVRLWDMYERKGSCESLEHSKEVLAVAFRPDGREFASASLSGEITFWDPEKATITGTIDGARDAAPGRSRDSRTVAPQKGHFQTLSYSADGRLLLAGAASRNVCVYAVGDGMAPCLVDKHPVTRNQDYDGLRDELNSKHVSASGHSTAVIDHEDEDAEAYGESLIARARSLPGAPSESLTKRKKLLKAEVKCVKYSPTGRMWAAVTHEGVLIYGEGLNGGRDTGDMIFDPVNLAVDVTPKNAEKAVSEKDYIKALLIALRLNERDLLSKVVESIPSDEAPLVINSVPSLYFVKLARLFTWRMENTPHIAYNLMWSRRLLLSHGSKAHQSAKDPDTVNVVLRALNRATSEQAKRLAPIADRNLHALQYLSELSQQTQQ